MTDLTAFLDSRWAFYLGCSEAQLRDGGRHVVSRPESALEPGSPWPLRRGSICLFTVGCGWLMSVPDAMCDAARSLCLVSSFEALVCEGDRLQQAWFDGGETNEARSRNRGDEGYGVMNRLAESLDLRGWSHYIHWYCDASSWRPKPDAHVHAIAEDRPDLQTQWQDWPGPMVSPTVQGYYEISDAFGYVLDGKLVSAAQLEASATDFAWEFGVDTLPEFRGRGFAPAVLNAVTAFIIERDRIPWYYCDAYNRPSRTLPRKAGYVRYGEGLFSVL